MGIRLGIFLCVGVFTAMSFIDPGSSRLHTPNALAYEASSSSFVLRGGGLDTMAGAASSSAFIDTGAGGQATIGLASSSAFISCDGVLCQQFLRVRRPEEQHYRWRNDDGSESTATWAASEDATFTVPQLATKRLRFAVSNRSDQVLPSLQLRLEVSGPNPGACSGASYTRVDTDTGWDTVLSSNFADGDATTNVASGVTDGNKTFKAGQIKESNDQTASTTLQADEFTEIEYALQATASSTAGASYCFRLTNAGSTTGFTYTQYAQATVSVVSLTLSIDAGNTISFGTVGFQSRVTRTTRLAVNTNNSSGYQITAGRQRAITNVTLASSASPATINISDTAGGIDVFTGLSGSCGTATWPGSAGVSTGLGFTLWASSINKNTSCWGSGSVEADSANRYTALQASSAASTFLNASSNAPNPSYASVGYSLERTSLQRSTTYTGQVVYSATTNP